MAMECNMAIIRNAKKKDFDYYLTNLDWDDGTEIDRSIKQFDRNEVFDHTYEKWFLFCKRIGI